MQRTGGKSLVVGILALSLILAGTGYAYWTDTLKVDINAKTGDFGVTFANLGLYAQYSDEEPHKDTWSIVDGIEKGYVSSNFFTRGLEYNIIAEKDSVEKYKKNSEGYHNVSFDAKYEKDGKLITKGPEVYVTAGTYGSDSIILSVNRMYPGYAQAFRSDVLNIGDIAAKLSNIKFSLNNEDVGNLDKMLGLAMYISNEQYASDDKDISVFKLAKTLKDKGQVFSVGGVDFIRLSALQDADIRKSLENNLILTSPDANNKMDMFLAIAMDPDAQGAYTTGSTSNMKDNLDSMSQNKKIEISIDLLWDQFNVDKKVNNPNILLKQN